jgi:hypothetical protein
MPTKQQAVGGCQCGVNCGLCGSGFPTRPLLLTASGLPATGFSLPYTVGSGGLWRSGWVSSGSAWWASVNIPGAGLPGLFFFIQYSCAGPLRTGLAAISGGPIHLFIASDAIGSHSTDITSFSWTVGTIGSVLACSPFSLAFTFTGTHGTAFNYSFTLTQP